MVGSDGARQQQQHTICGKGYIPGCQPWQHLKKRDYFTVDLEGEMAERYL